MQLKLRSSRNNPAASGAASRRRARVATRAETDGSTDAKRAIPLPRGGVWLNRKLHDHDVLYGSTFVIQRDRVGGPGLVLSKHSSDMIQVWVPGLPKDLVSSATPDAWGLQTTPKLPPEAGRVIDAEARDVGAPVAETETTAMVWLGSEEDGGDEDVREGGNPRRTRKVQFTCDRCGWRNTKLVNPHAWDTGAVLCRCENCEVVHLIRDQKGIFWGLKDEEFPRVQIGVDLPIPPTLEQSPDFDDRIGGTEWM